MGAESDKIRKAGKKYAEQLRSNTDLSAQQIENLATEHVAELQSIADTQKAADDAAIAAVETAQQEAEKSGADRLIEMGNRIKEQQKEGEDQVEADNRAARWTAAGELAASVANMIAVGSGNAVSQQYKMYSQDWMQKADRDIREHRARMDNLNERLRQQRERLDALKLGNAQTLAGMRTAAAGRQGNMQTQIVNAGYTGKLQAEQVRSTGANAAAQAGYSVEKDASATELSEKRIQQADEHFNAGMRAKGYNADGTINPTLYSQIAAMENAAKGSGSGTDKLIAYPILDKDGNVNVANMKPDEMKGLLTFAQGVIRDELGESEGKKFETEFHKAADAAAKSAVLVKWMKESKACGTAIRLIDANYKGQHGIGEGVASATPAPASGNTQTHTNNGVNPKTGLSTSYQ